MAAIPSLLIMLFAILALFLIHFIFKKKSMNKAIFRVKRYYL